MTYYVFEYIDRVFKKSLEETIIMVSLVVSLAKFIDRTVYEVGLATDSLNANYGLL